jgi:hypothetical protein
MLKAHPPDSSVAHDQTTAICFLSAVVVMWNPADWEFNMHKNQTTFGTESDELTLTLYGITVTAYELRMLHELTVTLSTWVRAECREVLIGFAQVVR